MIKLSKKVILFLMLVLNLFKQLVVGLSVFLFNRTLGSRMGVVICMGVIALALMLGLFVLALPANMGSENPANIKNNTVNTSVSVDATVEESYIPDESYQGDDVEDLLAQVSDDTDPRTIEDNIDEVNAFNFQATEFTDVSIGRSEPFAPQLFSPGRDRMIGPEGQEEGLSPEELAEIEAERRREEICDIISNDISLKGIVFEDDKDAPPMAIIEYIASDGSTLVQTVEPGDEIRLSSCSATVSSIEQSRINFISEDVTQSKRLPAFDDEDTEDIMVSDDSYDDLAAPPTPGGGDDSSITDAKKKIEEIDKLLDSF